uniref:Rubrerythrin family protein n=1 Tax=Dictyoglomus thermophilum TaxID=14 RepID=A0A7C3RK88_DICTH
MEEKILLKLQRNEITEHNIYKILSKGLKDKKNREILLKISQDEFAHYNVLRKITQKDLNPNKFKLYLYLFLTKIFGFTFVLKLMEKGEDKAIESYRKIINKYPQINEILDDEKEHEQKLLNTLDEERLNYIGSMVLGLSDALVELTGTLAGLTFAFQNTKLISISGLITGISAALSMAGSEYLSSKAESSERNPLKSAITTGITYIMTVLILILPYLITQNYILALILTLLFAVILVVIFNFYISVAKDYEFNKRFLEMTIIIFSVSFISFLIGVFVKKVLGINID